MFTDKEGNRYYHTEEACHVLDISRSTFLKRAKKERLKKWKVDDDKRAYYRVADVEGLRNRAVTITPFEEKRGGRAALAIA